MSTKANSEPREPDTGENCPECQRLRAEWRDPVPFLVAPADGGGWKAWAAALLRYFERHGPGPTQVVIICQPVRSERYVQMEIGHGFAHAEVGSNVYLMGDSRLSDTAEAALATVGWLPPDFDCDDQDEKPSNWRLPLLFDDWPHLTEMLVTTMIGVLEFDEAAETEMRIFRQHNACRNCSWLPNSAPPELSGDQPTRHASDSAQRNASNAQ